MAFLPCFPSFPWTKNPVRSPTSRYQPTREDSPNSMGECLQQSLDLVVDFRRICDCAGDFVAEPLAVAGAQPS